MYAGVVRDGAVYEVIYDIVDYPRNVVGVARVYACADGARAAYDALYDVLLDAHVA